MLTPWVARILFTNLAIFALQSFVPGAERYLASLALIPAYIPEQPWTLITYQFLHAGFGHVFFNMMSLYIFGPRLEAELGVEEFVALYLFSGAAGGLLSWVFSPGAVIVGASGAILGVTFGYARYWPRDQILIWFVPMQVRVAMVLMVALDLFGGFNGSGGGGVAHFAHLGGVAGAYLFLKVAERRPRLARFQAKQAAARTTRADLERWGSIPREGLHEVNREEYDRIMRKIHDEGPESVSAQERIFFDAFSQR